MYLKKLLADVPPMVYKYISEIAASFVKVAGAVGPLDIHDSTLPATTSSILLLLLIEKFLVLDLLGSTMSVAVTDT